MQHKKRKKLELKKIILGMKLLWTYITARIILLFHYDNKLFLDGRSYSGSKYGKFTAEGWKWIVDDYITCRKMRVNTNIPWPVTPRISIINPYNIVFCADDLNNFQSYGIYFQAFAKITIGHGTYIAPNVGIITSNHNVNDLTKHDEPKPVTICENCWIGMNSIILPGVTLGPRTIVGAGSVVTKSFSEGNYIIAGNPAKVIKVLEDNLSKNIY